MTTETRYTPFLADTVKTEDVTTKGKKGSFAAKYVSWAKSAKAFNEHCDGWTWHLKPYNEGGYVWLAPNGTGYLVTYFKDPNGNAKTDFIYAIMDYKNSPIQHENIDARTLADNTRRCFCANLCKQFSFAYQLWSDIEIEDEKKLDNTTTATEQQDSQPNIPSDDIPLTPIQKEVLIQKLQQVCYQDTSVKYNCIQALIELNPEYANDEAPSLTKFITQRKHQNAIKKVLLDKGYKT